MLNRKELHSNFSKVYNIVCILRVFPELLEGVGAGGCSQGMYWLKMTKERRAYEEATKLEWSRIVYLCGWLGFWLLTGIKGVVDKYCAVPLRTAPEGGRCSKPLGYPQEGRIFPDMSIPTQPVSRTMSGTYSKCSINVCWMGWGSDDIFLKTVGRLSTSENVEGHHREL